MMVPFPLSLRVLAWSLADCSRELMTGLNTHSCTLYYEAQKHQQTLTHTTHTQHIYNQQSHIMLRLKAAHSSSHCFLAYLEATRADNTPNTATVPEEKLLQSRPSLTLLLPVTAAHIESLFLKTSALTEKAVRM